jgi:hypothetical protein
LAYLALAYYPFPVRKNKELAFPSKGYTWVSCFELEAWLKLHGKKGIKIEKSYTLTYTLEKNSFQKDLEKIYTLRNVYKNSLFIKKFSAMMYGKTIQTKGISKLFNPFYAALITGYTRSKLIEHLTSDIICFLTDCIITKQEDLTLTTGLEIGNWDATKWEGGGLFVKPGIYEMYGKESTITKLSGFSNKAEVDIKKIYTGAVSKGYYITKEVPVFFRDGAKLCKVKNTLRLKNRKGNGLFRKHFGTLALSFYRPLIGNFEKSEAFVPETSMEMVDKYTAPEFKEK